MDNVLYSATLIGQFVDDMHYDEEEQRFVFDKHYITADGKHECNGRCRGRRFDSVIPHKEECEHDWVFHPYCMECKKCNRQESYGFTVD